MESARLPKAVPEGVPGLPFAARHPGIHPVRTSGENGDAAEIFDRRFAHIAFSGLKRQTQDALPRSQARPRSSRSEPEQQADSEALVAFDPVESEFVHSVIRRAGLQEEAYRLAPLIRRLPACLRTLRVGSLAEARSRLDRNPDLWSRALDTLLIGTTGFFRDPAVFDHLRDEAIPSLLATTPHPAVWSAACSNGAELHSVAMAFATSGPLRRGQFLGTDCRESVVETARRGRYPIGALHEIPALLHGFTVEHGDFFSIREDLMRASRWRTADLLHGPMPEGSWHMILCRNLAIYLGAASSKRLWKRLSNLLLPGGYLIVGKAEKPREPGLVRVAPCIYRKPRNDRSRE